VNSQMDGVIQGLVAIFYNLYDQCKVQNSWIFYLAGIVALLSILRIYSAKQHQKPGEQRRKRMKRLSQDKATVKKKATELFTQQYLALYSPRSKVIQSRIKMITQRAMAKLCTVRDDALEIMSDPEVQHNLQLIQEKFASSEDEYRADLQIDMFIDAIEQPRHTLAQSLANDGVRVLTKLTKQHLDIISLLFILRYTRDSNNSCLTSIQQYTTKYIMPFFNNLPREAAIYHYLEECGCTHSAPSPIALERLLLESYPAVFQYLGFSQIEMEEIVGEKLVNEDLLVPSLFDPKLWKINAIDDEMSIRLLRQAGLTAMEVTAMQKLQQSRPAQCSEEGIQLWLPHIYPQLGELSDLWSQSPLQITALSPLGIYIAHANIKKRLGESLTTIVTI